MKKTLLAITAVLMIAPVACGDDQSLSDAEIVAQKSAMSQEFMAIEGLPKIE